MRWRTAPCECEGYDFRRTTDTKLFKQIEHPSTTRPTTRPCAVCIYYRCTPNASKRDSDRRMDPHVSDARRATRPASHCR
jgi:hypothetical protein